MSGPEFSVIMPAYRSAGTIGAALRSIQSQTVSDLEVIVVDDGSGDSTPDVVEAMAADDDRIKLIRQENAGTAAARNTAIAASGGRILALLDNDDAWLPHHLAGISAAFASGPKIGLAFADAWTFSMDRERMYRHSVLAYRPWTDEIGDGPGLLRALGRVNFIIASTCAFSREAYDAAGPFDPAISGSDDWDMWLRIAAAGYGGARAGEGPQIVLRDSSTSQSKDQAMILRTSIEVLDGALAREPEGHADGALAPARRTRTAYAAQLAAMEGRAGPSTWRHQFRQFIGATKQSLLRRWYWRPAPPEVRDVLR